MKQVEYANLRAIVSKHYKAMLEEVLRVVGVKNFEDSGLAKINDSRRSFESKINQETDTMALIVYYEQEYMKLKDLESKPKQGNKDDMSCVQIGKVDWL